MCKGRGYITFGSKLKFRSTAHTDPSDNEFFKDIFEEHSDRVYKIAYGFLVDPEDAEDVVQETFLKIYRNIEGFKSLDREKLISMIVIYAKNTSRDLLRKRSRKNNAVSLTCNDEEAKENEEYEIPYDGDTPEEITVKRDISERLEKYVNMLPGSQREVIMLKFYHGMKEKEIAAILNIKESTVSTRLSRAKANLRKMIGGSKDEEDLRNR